MSHYHPRETAAYMRDRTTEELAAIACEKGPRALLAKQEIHRRESRPAMRIAWATLGVAVATLVHQVWTS